MVEGNDKRLAASAGSRTYLGLLIATAGLIRVIVAVRAQPDGLFDDAYVTLRYAANLIKGWGFVFNAGERVMGTTNAHCLRSCLRPAAVLLERAIWKD